MPTDPIQTNLDASYRALLILWFALSMSVLIFLLFVQISPVDVNPNPKLSLALNVLGVVPVAVSFLIKQRMLDKAVQEQRIYLVQVAYVVSFALCEVAALLGLMDYFLTGSQFYLVSFGLTGSGMLLHFPLKKKLIAASDEEF